MNSPSIIQNLRAELSDSIGATTTPTAAPLAVSPWIAMSILQKSIRRGNVRLALRAAATLLIDAPEKLWRRLGAIAFEDVGLGDLNAAVAATVSLGGKRFRATLGGEWRVASHIVNQLAMATKCRAADDLLMVVELHPFYSSERIELSERSTANLLQIAAGSDPLPVRALAVWFALGTDRRPSPHLRYRRGSPEEVFDGLLEMNCPLTLVQAAEENFRRIGEVLPVFVALLFRESSREQSITRDVLTGDVFLKHDVPAWSLDTYSREGRRALHAFLKGKAATSELLRSRFAPGDRLNVLAHALFRVEGGLVERRLDWEVARTLRRQLDLECFPGGADGQPILESLRADLVALNEERVHVL